MGKSRRRIGRENEQNFGKERARLGRGMDKYKKSGKWLKFRSTRAERWSSGC
jgi:hypothetical protein